MKRRLLLNLACCAGCFELTSPAFAKAPAGTPAAFAKASAGTPAGSAGASSGRPAAFASSFTGASSVFARGASATFGQKVSAAFGQRAAGKSSGCNTNATIPLIAPGAVECGTDDSFVVSEEAADMVGEQAGESAVAPEFGSEGGKKKWWMFGLVLIAFAAPIVFAALIVLADVWICWAGAGFAGPRGCEIQAGEFGIGAFVTGECEQGRMWSQCGRWKFTAPAVLLRTCTRRWRLRSRRGNFPLGRE
jgi:hypothetical protein